MDGGGNHGSGSIQVGEVTSWGWIHGGMLDSLGNLLGREDSWGRGGFMEKGIVPDHTESLSRSDQTEINQARPGQTRPD